MEPKNYTIDRFGNIVLLKDTHGDDNIIVSAYSKIEASKIMLMQAREKLGKVRCTQRTPGAKTANVYYVVDSE